jgi:tetratricopeptide (TPR) repeat protein
MTASAGTAGSPDARRSVGAQFLTATAAVAVILLLAQTSQAAEACKPLIAQIVSLQGQVEVQSSGSSEWTAAALNEQLCIGDAVRVGPFARAALAFANESVLRLDQRTTLYLRGESEEGRSLLQLLFGAVYFFSHRPRALEVDTPYVNAAAEGTEFLVRVADDRAEAIVFEGRILMQNPVGELRLAGGDAGVALKGKAPQSMIVVRPRDAVTWTLYYPPILAPLAERHAAPHALPDALQAAVDRVAANDYGGAVAALDAVPEAARDARYYTYRAGVLLNVGRTEEAAAAIERALALNPDAAEALAQRAVIAVVQNRRSRTLSARSS